MPLFRIKAIWFWILVFGISMAFVESAVVVYLRELYYPGGFSFPLVPMSDRIALTEIFRELATLIMLMAAGFLAGKNSRQRFAWFIIGFGIWDIFYYVFLKILLNWPDSWLTWDILFLIPVIWTSPVLVPILVSFTMIMLSASVLYRDSISGQKFIPLIIWLFIITGSLLIFLSCIWDYCTYLASRNALQFALNPGVSSGFVRSYIPSVFQWTLFLAGEAAEIAAIGLLLTGARVEDVS